MRVLGSFACGWALLLCLARVYVVILAIAAGYDMIDAGSTKNIMNRGMLEWLKNTKYSPVT